MFLLLGTLFAMVIIISISSQKAREYDRNPTGWAIAGVLTFGFAIFVLWALGPKLISKKKRKKIKKEKIKNRNKDIGNKGGLLDRSEI